MPTLRTPLEGIPDALEQSGNANLAVLTAAMPGNRPIFALDQCGGAGFAPAAAQ